jgi:quinol monooxygenase YgiN
MARVGRYVKMSAQPGQGEALGALMLEVAGSLSAAPGCELYAINRAVDDSDVVWVTEVWVSQQALDDSLAILRTDEGRARLGEVQALLAGPPGRTDLEPLGGIGLAG